MAGAGQRLAFAQDGFPSSGGSRPAARLPGHLGHQNTPPFFTHTPGPAQSPVPSAPPSALPRAPPSKPFPWSSSEEVPPRLCRNPSGWRRKGWVICHRAELSLVHVPIVINALPFPSSGSFNLRMPTGPTVWPWPLRTFCGGPGATREPWSHCKCFPRLCCFPGLCLTSGWPSCGQAGWVSLG